MQAKKFFRIPYPRPRNLAYPDRVLSDAGELSRSDPFNGQSESWPRRGPRNGRWTGGQGGAPGGAAPYVTGRARLALSAARGEAVLVSRVPAGALAPPAAPSPRAGRAREMANLGRIAPRECESVAI